VPTASLARRLDGLDPEAIVGGDHGITMPFDTPQCLAISSAFLGS
jgi:hypothetical protein